MDAVSVASSRMSGRSAGRRPQADNMSVHSS